MRNNSKSESGVDSNNDDHEDVDQKSEPRFSIIKTAMHGEREREILSDAAARDLASLHPLLRRRCGYASERLGKLLCSSNILYTPEY